MKVDMRWLCLALCSLAPALGGCGAALHVTTIQIPLTPASFGEFPATPTVAPPKVVLPVLAGSVAIGWQNRWAGSLSMSSCTVDGHAAYAVPISLTKAQAALTGRMRALGYLPNGSGFSTGPYGDRYTIEALMFVSTKHPHLDVDLAFQAQGTSTAVGYWVSDVLQAKQGAVCSGLSG